MAHKNYQIWRVKIGDYMVTSPKEFLTLLLNLGGGLFRARTRTNLSTFGKAFCLKVWGGRIGKEREE
jgi:hypothetical protein